MRENKMFAWFKRIFFTSPYLLLIFLLIPAVIFIGRYLGIPIILGNRNQLNLMLINNACLLLVITIRFFRYLFRTRADIRYGADFSPPHNVLTLEQPEAQLQAKLTGAGYRFDASGRYGEKRDLGFLGTALLYGGLVILLLFGTWDNMRQFNGMVRSGVGMPIPLSTAGSYGGEMHGPLASMEGLPKLKVTKQILPSTEWPKGATEIALLNKDNKELVRQTISPDKPFSYRGLKFSMAGFVFDVFLVVTNKDHVEFTGFVKLLPLLEKKGDYSYSGGVRDKDFGSIQGQAWLNPEKKALKVEVSRDKKPIIDTELHLWGVNTKSEGGFAASFQGLSHWSEIRVQRQRHVAMLAVGAVITLTGLLLRIAIRPRRVWLEEADGGCRVRYSGGETLRVVEGKL